jgi:hypothetical protein
MTTATRSTNEKTASVAVALTGRTERLLLRLLNLLGNSFPILDYPATHQARQLLATAVVPESIDAVLSDSVALVWEMSVAMQSLPKALTGGNAPRETLLLMALIEAAQRRDRGRAIEAAMLLLNTTAAGGAVRAAERLARTLKRNHLHLVPIGRSVFEYFAGYAPLQSLSGTRREAAEPLSQPPRLRLLPTLNRQRGTVR